MRKSLKFQELICKTEISSNMVPILKCFSNGKEHPRAFVVRRDGSVSAQGLDEFIRSQFASHKWLTGGIYFLDELPRSASGKILKRALLNPTLKMDSKL